MTSAPITSMFHHLLHTDIDLVAYKTLTVELFVDEKCHSDDDV